MNTYLIGQFDPDDIVIRPFAILTRPVGMSQPDFAALVQLVSEALPMADHLEPDFEAEAVETSSHGDCLVLDFCPTCERVSRSVRERRYSGSRHPNPLLNFHYGCADCYEAADREMTENLRNV